MVSSRSISHILADYDDVDMDIDVDDCVSVASMPPFSPAPSEARSLESAESRSMRSASPAASVMSFTSSIRAQAYREEYGRYLNNYSDVYLLPADEEEMDRLSKQHLMFVEVMGTKYAPPMEQVMEDAAFGETKACLDLGCGSGCWIMDVARDFPHCQAVAVDLVPMQSRAMPPNCRSEVDDINLGLEHFYGDFDVVHTRLISSGIKDYRSLIEQISKVLRPGGLIDLSESDFHCYDQAYRRIELEADELGPPWLPRWLAFARKAVRTLGGNIDAATYIYDWVKNHHAFEPAVYREFWLPVSPWFKGDEFQQRMGTVMRDDLLSFFKSGRPLLLGTGLNEGIVDLLERETTEELMQARFPHWLRLRCVYARKKFSI